MVIAIGILFIVVGALIWVVTDLKNECYMLKEHDKFIENVMNHNLKQAVRWMTETTEVIQGLCDKVDAEVKAPSIGIDEVKIDQEEDEN